MSGQRQRKQLQMYPNSSNRGRRRAKYALTLQDQSLVLQPVSSCRLAAEADLTDVSGHDAPAALPAGTPRPDTSTTSGSRYADLQLLVQVS